MRTAIKFDRLADVKPETGENVKHAQRRVLAGAINFELMKTALCLEIVRGNAHKVSAAFHAAANEPAFTPPGFERIKSFLQARFPELGIAPAGQKFANASTNPVLNDVSNEFEQYFHNNMPEIDTGWMGLYDEVDLRKSTHDHFDIISTGAGIVFEQITQGGEIRVRREISENKIIVPMVTYGAGLGVLDEWIDDQKFWKIDEVVAEFRAQYFDILASVHYSLLTGQGAGIDVAFTVDDTTTFNAAAAAILRGVFTSGYATGNNPGFYIICSPEKLGRVLKILDATQGSFIVAMQANKEPIAYTVRGVIATTKVSNADTGYYLVLPGRKLKRGIKRDMAIESARDIYHRSNDWVGSTRFGCGAGDVAQFRRVKYA